MASSVLHRQSNPFLLHQQRQYHEQQQHSYFNSNSNNNNPTQLLYDQDKNVDHIQGQYEAVSDTLNMDSSALPFLSSTSSKAASESSTHVPINYMFSEATTAIFSSESPLLLTGDGQNGRIELESTNVTEYYNNIFVMSGLTGAAGFDSDNQFTTLSPDNESDFVARADNASNMSDAVGLENWWDVFDEQYLRHSLGWTVTLVVAYTLILVIGIIGNCMVILVVVFRPQMRTVTNMFIMNLALADGFVVIFCLPATLLSNVFTPWILGSFMCKGVAYVQGVSVCASAYSLAAISLDRCKAIYRPMERPRGLSKSQALSTICLIWVFALLLTIPWAVIFQVTINEKDGLSYCVETWKNEQHGKIYFLVANLICCYSLPLVLISLSNIVIWCNVARRKVPQDSASVGTIKRMHRRTRHGVRKMLGIVTLAFLLSWLPLYIIVTRVKFFKNIGDDEQTVLQILLPFAQWLGSWNSSINPVLYAFLNSKFREMFKSLLPSWVPFVHRNSNTRITRNNVGRGTVTNGTFTVGTNGSPSYSTVLTARSSGRSSSNSRRFHHHHQHPHHKSYYNNHRTLLVSSFRGEPNPTTRITPAAATTTTVSALVGAGAAGGGNCGGGGARGGNGTSTITTATMAVANITTTATITDL